METHFTKDPGGKKMTITRDFNAPLADVWQAWTESDLLDQWWAPRPWKTETKSMDFKNGGQWLYAMAGPNGEKHWNRVEFGTIDLKKSFTATSLFIDDDGNIIESFSPMYWYNRFSETSTGSRVVVEVSFDNEAGLQQIIEMGFKDGFTMALGNLDELLAK